MAKFELLSDGTAYKGEFYTKGDVIDFGDEVDTDRLEEDGHIGPEGTLKKRTEEADKAAQDKADWEAEKAERTREANLKLLAADRNLASGNNEDAPPAKRPYNRRK